MLQIQEIIDEVVTLVPNTFGVAKNVTWLNEINKEFFEFVKIPKIHRFLTVGGQENYTLPSDVRGNNIVRVQVDTSMFDSIQYDDFSPGHNYWNFDETTKELSLNPIPLLTNKVGLVNYHMVGTTVFTTGALTIEPDAPDEYHWAYVLGLAERTAKAMNDVTLANNYGNDYRVHLQIAQNSFATRPKGV